MAPAGGHATYHISLQDSSSFIAGERSALLRAFRETLPSQQAIGSLYHAVHQITGRMDQEACDVRKVGLCCNSSWSGPLLDTCPAVTPRSQPLRGTAGVSGVRGTAVNG